MNRRIFLKVGSAACVASAMPDLLHAQMKSTPVAATLFVDSSARHIPVSANFTGLSYESAQLASPGYFSAKNVELVRLVRQLGHGVLRIGGNTSDYDKWEPGQVPKAASWNNAVGPDAGLNDEKGTVVSKDSINELRTFLDATGWQLLYGIDLGHGSPERAADEAAYVVKTIGSSLLALQIGNEADLFYRNGIRKPSYDYSDYFSEWQRFAKAIRKRTSNAPLAGPDVGHEISWVENFAKDADGIKLLTSHHYAEGPPSNPKSDIPHLLHPHPGLVKNIQHLVSIGRSAGVPYRMSEGNSCYHGGKPGVSNTFASALWGADFMFLLAELGVTGVNFHGGGQGYYTPIAGGGSMPLVVRPLYYGMLLFREFQPKQLFPCSFETGGVNATAYAGLDHQSRTKVIIINKDIKNSLNVNLSGRALCRTSLRMALRAPSVESTQGITLAGHELSSADLWHGSFASSRHRHSVEVPSASALLLEFEGDRS